MKNSRNQRHIAERLKDRQAYRETLIDRLLTLKQKLAALEEEIGGLRKAAA